MHHKLCLRLLELNGRAVGGIGAGFAQPRRFKVTDVQDVVGWKRVEKPSKLTATYSGDLGTLEPVDLNQPQISVRTASDAVQRTDEITRRVLSLEFARGKEKSQVQEEKAVAFIQRHRFDQESPEAKIGRMTVQIRRLQQQLLQPEFARAGPLRCRLLRLVDQRGRQLRQLRAADYRRFEWLLDQMNIIYRPPLPYQTDTRLTRKTGIRRMVQVFCDSVRQQKLDELREEFDSQKPEFEREKREVVQWIAEEERALGLPPSVDPEKGELLEKRLPKRLVVPPRREQAAS